MNFLKEIDGLPTGLTFLEIHMTGFVGVPADELRWVFCYSPITFKVHLFLRRGKPHHYFFSNACI